MIVRAVGINPKVLKWARERSGHSLVDVARVMGKEVDQIESWEAGESEPTYIQLEKLAYKIYKRPLAVFYFPEPPKETEIKKTFRTLPEFEVEALETDTLYALRYAQARQIALRELCDGVNRAERKIFNDIQFSIDINIDEVVNYARDYIGVSLKEQVSWNTPREALSLWRNHIEAVGIYVFKRHFKQEDFSGFCLLDDEFPLIYLDSGEVKVRQIFTLFHELAHILFKVNGVTKKDENYIAFLKGDVKKIEILCNRFAGEFLVPTNDFLKRIQFKDIDDSTIYRQAKYYNVSRVVILRKLLANNIVDSNYYTLKINQWDKEYQASLRKSTKRTGGGDYYKTQVSYLGNSYLKLVFGEFRKGWLTIDKVADYLGVKVKYLADLEHTVTNKVASV